MHGGMGEFLGLFGSDGTSRFKRAGQGLHQVHDDVLVLGAGWGVTGTSSSGRVEEEWRSWKEKNRSQI